MFSCSPKIMNISRWLFYFDWKIKPRHIPKKTQRSWNIFQRQSVCQVKCLAEGLAQNPSGQHTLTSLNVPQCHTISAHTHTTLHALSRRSGNGCRGVRPSVKVSSCQGAHLWSPWSSVDSRLCTKVSKSQLEKHNIAVNTSNRVILNGRKFLPE